MRKLFWAIQGLNHLGGTETVSVKLMNLLCDEYEVHLISASEIKGPISYDIDPRVQIHCLSIPSEVIAFDQCALSYLEKFKLIKICRLIHRFVSTCFYRRNKFRDRIASWMDEDSIYIGSDIVTYWLAPKKKHVIFHFHFNAKMFFEFANQFAFRHSVKPEKYVFLTEATLKQILKKRPKLKSKATYVHNPTRFSPTEEYSHHGNRILFVGHLIEVKDPMLTLEIAKQLHEDNFPFSLQMYGDGHLEERARNFVEENSLGEVSIVANHKVVPEDYLSSDLLLCTSRHEGFYLAAGEANANSCPVLTAHWGGEIDEVIVNGQSGWILEGRDPKDYARKIEEILSDKEGLIEAKKRAYQDSFRFGDGPVKKKWEEILNNQRQKENHPFRGGLT